MFTTPVVVTAADRVGLLHDLAHAIDAAGYDIRRAMITTVHGVARDTFELTDAEGAPPEPDVLSASLGEALEQAAGA